MKNILRHCRTQLLRPLRPCANQRGMALIIAISVLAIMSILGGVLMTTSTTEIQLSGNYRRNLESFYAADRALTYVYRGGVGVSDNPIDLYNAQDASVSPAVYHRDRLVAGSGGLEQSSYVANQDDRNSIVYLGSSPPPAGLPVDISMFKAKNYSVRVDGVSPVNSSSPSRTSIRSQYSIIVPK